MSSEEDELQQTATDSLRSRRRKSPRAPRSALDTSLWTFCIRATRLRSLRLPTWAAVIRGVHVFTTLDKQARQSRGSKWRHETATGPGALVGTRASSPVARRRRGSSMPEEVHWVQHDGELQWTLQRDRFRHLKAYSPRIKVYVYGLRTVTGAAETAATTPFNAENLTTTAKASDNSSVVSFGWFFLDLRTPDLPERWVTLQSSPFGGEIQISTSLSPFNPNENPVAVSQPVVAFQQRPATTESVPMAAVPMATTENGDYLRLGKRNGTDIFIISVFVQSAFNLAEVVENAIGTRKQNADIYMAGFWLSYSLFEVVVQTDVFHNLEVAEFAPIRDNFRVLSCLEDLQEFFQSQQESLTMYLCTENRVLADVEIPTSSLLAHEFFSSSVEATQVQEASMEGTFAFVDTSNAVVAVTVSIESAPHQSMAIESTEETKEDGKESQVRPALDEENQGSELAAPEASKSARASIAFKLDHIRLRNKSLLSIAGKEEVLLELSAGTSSCTDAIAFCAFMEEHVVGENETIKTVAEISESELHSLPIQVRCFLAATNATIAVYSADLQQAGITSLEECISGLSLDVPLLGHGDEQLGECRLRIEEKLDEGGEINETPSPTQEGDVHVYRIFVNLKSIRDVQNTPREVLLTYENPFNGKGKVESDVMQVTDKGEVGVTKSMCTFETTKAEQSFKQAMNSWITIDLSEKRVDGSLQLIGNALFSLNYLYFSQERYCCADPACGKTFQIVSDGIVHWEQAHQSTIYHGDQVDADQRIHRFKSCSIYIPIMTIADQESAATSTSQQIGAVRVVAYVEDMGLLPKGSMALTRPTLLGETHTARIFPTDMRRIAAMTSSLESPSRATTIARKQEPWAPSLVLSETLDVVRGKQEEVSSSRMSPAQTLESMDHQHQRLLDLDQKMREVMTMKESLDRERISWRQEQKTQQAEWKKRMAELEKARMDELEEEWARREEERSTLLRSTQGEYQRLEQTLRTSLVEMEKRERKLAESERNLQREQQTQREENELARKRMQSEHAHAMSLVQKQIEVHERQAKLLDEQVRDAEARAKQLETDFAEYRRQQRKVPEARLLEEIASLKGGMMELERQKMAQEKAREAAEVQIEKLNAQVDKMTRLLHAEKHKNEVRAIEEVEKLRVKYLAREEKYILDGDREELRAIKKQLEMLRGLSLRRESQAADGSDLHQDYISPSLSDDHRRQKGRDGLKARRNRHRQSTQKLSNVVRARASDSGDQSSQFQPGRLASSFSSTGERDRTGFELNESVSEVSMPDHNDIVLHHDGSDDNINQVKSDFNAANTAHYERELDRLKREKQLLLASGAYDEESYLVRELTRLIEETRAKTEFPQHAF